jgi:hypothetical protein
VVRVGAIVMLLSATAVADPDPAASFATELGVAATHEVRSFAVSAGDMTHVAIGRYDSGTYTMAAVVLLRCDASTCDARKIELGAAEAVDVLGVADLQGAPAPLPSRAIEGARAGGSKAMKFPVVVVRARETKSRSKLYLISLLEADRGSVVLQDIATEGGTSRTYKLDKGDDKTNLDVVAAEKRAGCTPTEPIEARYALEEHHFRTKSYNLAAAGCDKKR